MVRVVLEKREYDEMREEYEKEHQLRFTFVMEELKYIEDFNWTPVFQPRVVVTAFSLTKSVNCCFS